MPAGAIIGGAVSLIGGIFGSSRAKREARRREREAGRLQSKLNRLEANRQQIINPYDNVTDLSSMLSNPFASLSVATQAAEMQMEQTDVALANTLDTIRATGGAGSATALAQAALQSKKNIAANIESQEATNEKLRAQGEATLQRQQMAEAQRQQMADVQGESFVFGQRENREMQQLNRLTNQIGALRGAAAQASADSTAAITGGIGAAASILGSADWDS
jgi:chromosome segregation ATPase